MRPAVVNPSMFLVIAANLLPIAGIVWWGWDAFVLLMLYWLETAIIGFWTVARIIVNPSTIDLSGQPLNRVGLAGRIGVAGFITVHAGIFMAVHFVFLWALFSGDWGSEIHGPLDFVRVMVVGTDLWIPLAFLFVVRGLVVLGPAVRRGLGFVADPPPEPAGDNPVMGLYVRIVVMQVTIIVGAWFAVLAGGSIAALVLLVVLKTMAEVFYDAIVRHLETKGAAAGGG